MMPKVWIFLIVALSMTGCANNPKGKTIGELRAEYQSYFQELDAKFKKVAQQIESEPVDTLASCNLTEKLNFRYTEAGFNADYLVQNEMQDWMRTGGEALGTAFSLSYIKHTMYEMLRAPHPEKDRDADPDGSKEDKIKLLQKTKYFVIANRPAENGVGLEKSKMDFYVYNIENQSIDCRFSLIANSHSGEGIYEVQTYRGGILQNTEFQYPGMDMERKEIEEGMDIYLRDSLGATLRK